MLKAKVIVPFRGVRDGEVHPVKFNTGDTVEGELAALALGEGWAKRDKGPAPENKALGGAPHNRAGFPGGEVGEDDSGGERAKPKRVRPRKGKGESQATGGE